jgi:uncharacterized membrane protein YkoI
MRYTGRPMKTTTTRRTLLLALALLPERSGLAYGDDDDDDDDDDKDHSRASRAVEQGGARPLADILNQLHGRLGGEIVGMKFKRNNGRYVYKLKVVTPAGQLREVSIDAATGEIMQSKGG